MLVNSETGNVSEHFKIIGSMDVILSWEKLDVARFPQSEFAKQLISGAANYITDPEWLAKELAELEALKPEEDLGKYKIMLGNLPWGVRLAFLAQHPEVSALLESTNWYEEHGVQPQPNTEGTK